ncbi:MAG: hypothetical protein IPM82_17500 [Saprospiraceae bacterium]|nr:hypothetical protein [Saprospiraceae bacterium]
MFYEGQSWQKFGGFEKLRQQSFFRIDHQCPTEFNYFLASTKQAMQAHEPKTLSLDNIALKISVPILIQNQITFAG